MNDLGMVRVFASGLQRYKTLFQSVHLQASLYIQRDKVLRQSKKSQMRLDMVSKTERRK